VLSGRTTSTFGTDVIGFCELKINGNILPANASDIIDQHLINCEGLYKSLLEVGVAKECARFVLPITTQTKIYMKGSIRSWIHYLMIRCDEHTQLEHREIAEHIRELFNQHFPNISKALNQN
jgi:thymidylate synthase (FAD)